MAKRTQLYFAKPKIPVKRINSRIALTIFPIKIHGLNFPHRLLVLSTIFPNSGSINNSKIRTETIKPVINPISLLATVLLSPANIPLVTKIIK